jgi:hypothetical protein
VASRELLEGLLGDDPRVEQEVGHRELRRNYLFHAEWRRKSEGVWHAD